MLITGPKSDLTRILESQDEAAYLPLPPSVYRHGQRVNVCPECMRPIALHKFEDYKAPWQWQCSECGWEPGIAARTTCVESLCRAVEVDGVMVAQCCDAVRGVTGVREWVAPVAVREGPGDDLGETSEPPRKL